MSGLLCVCRLLFGQAVIQHQETPKGRGRHRRWDERAEPTPAAGQEHDAKKKTTTEGRRNKTSEEIPIVACGVTALSHRTSFKLVWKRGAPIPPRTGKGRHSGRGEMVYFSLLDN